MFITNKEIISEVFEEMRGQFTNVISVEKLEADCRDRITEKLKKHFENKHTVLDLHDEIVINMSQVEIFVKKRGKNLTAFIVKK